jgi:hypothetical protein
MSYEFVSEMRREKEGQRRRREKREGKGTEGEDSRAIKAEGTRGDMLGLLPKLNAIVTFTKGRSYALGVGRINSGWRFKGEIKRGRNRREGEGRREKGEGRKEKGEGRREKGEGEGRGRGRDTRYSWKFRPLRLAPDDGFIKLNWLSLKPYLCPPLFSEKN